MDDHSIETFLEKLNKKVPDKEPDLDKLLLRLQNIGVLTDQERKDYLQRRFKEEK